MIRGLRGRLASALVALVTVTVLGIGIGTYAFVDARLREGLLTEASRQVQFNLSVLVPERLPAGSGIDTYRASGLPEAFRLRGDSEAIVDFGAGEVDVSTDALAGAIDDFPASLTTAVDSGRLAYAWLAVAERPSLVVGGREGSGPAFYFVFPTTSIDAALEQLRLGLLAGGLVALLLAVAVAGLVARRILGPIGAASVAAGRIAAGDLTARVPVTGTDELAGLAAELNRMAATLEATVGRLEAAQRQNRRFVADVAHELRTPLTALVAEASVIESGLPALPPDARRAGELLVADVRRLRGLVEDLMELSRFDAEVEEANLVEVDLTAAVRSILTARLPGATFEAPTTPVVVRADMRRLDRILGNLLDNAVVHAPAAAVEVAVRTSGEAVEVEVADRGPGVPAAFVGRLFDRFSKADPSRASGSSGLGLAIAAEHARLLGGSLEAANRDGGGLRVTLRLPRLPESLPDGDDPDAREVDAAP